MREPEGTEREAAAGPGAGKRWVVGLLSFGFILLQSACTAVMAVSGVRVVIGLGALAAATGLGRPSAGFHANAIRVPMMVFAVVGSLVNLYVIWRIRTLRSRPSARWRTVPVTKKTLQSERFQIALSVLSLALVAVEQWTHTIVHNAP